MKWSVQIDCRASFISLIVQEIHGYKDRVQDVFSKQAIRLLDVDLMTVSIEILPFKPSYALCNDTLFVINMMINSFFK